TNVSARSEVGTGGDILIAGFNIAGSGTRTLLIRAIGPTLGTAFQVDGVLANPKLELYRSGNDTPIAENDDWDSATATPIFRSVGAFELPDGSLDAVLVVSLPPGGYTANVSGVNDGTGVALVELYEVP